MIIGKSYIPIKTNYQNVRKQSSIASLKASDTVSFGGKIYSNEQLDKIIKYYKSLQEQNQNKYSKMVVIEIKTKMAEILENRTVNEKKIFERELANRAMELAPDLKEVRMEEYKKYYRKHEYCPPAGKIGMLKQEASDYANRKLIEVLIGELV